MKTPCKAVREQLPLFVGGDLESERAAGVRAHLIDCCACRGEASALQQATAALGQLAAVDTVGFRTANNTAGDDTAGVGDAMFAAMHQQIMSRVAAAAVPEAAGAGRSSRWLLGIAAAVLVGAGFWWGYDRWQPSVWRRAPLATPVADQGPAIVVPWSGPRVEIRPLGDEAPPWFGRGAESGYGPGMMGRGRLRSLVDEDVPLTEGEVVEPGERGEQGGASVPGPEPLPRRPR